MDTASLKKLVAKTDIHLGVQSREGDVHYFGWLSELELSTGAIKMVFKGKIEHSEAIFDKVFVLADGKIVSYYKVKPFESNITTIVLDEV